MDIILIPGFWLDASSWDEVIPALRQAGHHVQALTLPGMESKDADRSQITLRDHIDAVVEAIDSVDPASGQVVLVGHSAGSGVASTALDARVDRVSRIFYVGGFPAGAGGPLFDGAEAANGEVPMPDWTEFDDADIADLDEPARADFRARAIPAPELIVRDPVRLTDERRYDVPATAVCPEYTAETLREWIAADMAPVREFPKIRDLDYVDLHSGHWPQFTRPDDLAQLILDRI